MKRLSFVVLSLMLFAVACFPIVKGQGEIVTERRTYDVHVEGLAVSSGIDVVLDSTLAPGEAMVTTSQNIMEYVEIEVSGDSLNIGMRRGQSYNVDKLEVRLSPEGFTTFAVSGGAELESLEALDIDGDMTIAVSGGADLTLRGRCRNLSVAASGGADVNLADMCAERVLAAASGGADLEVYATTAYEINASGGADVEYRATSATTTIHSSGGAEISAKHL